MEAKEGDKVKVTKKDWKQAEGILMPNKETKAAIIKLKSGYNVVIDRKNIKKMEVIEKAKPKKEKKEEKLKEKKGLPTIAVLHTGGTIASKVDYETGGVTAHFTAAELIEMVPELADIANVKTELVANMM